MAKRLPGLPRRQRLIGLWLLLSGVSIFGGATFALWLDTLFQPEGLARLALWLGCFSGGGTIFLVGLLLERQLFTPLRHLQVQLARLVANPDARDDYPPEGWLRGLGPDLVRVRDAWRADRGRLATAHAEGARSAARIRQELETLLQVLDTPLLLCDQHRRVLLFNQAAETLFEGHHGLGLGKRLEALLPAASLQDALGQLPGDGSPREVLVPCDERWLRAVLRRVPGSHGESLLTLTDTTAAWTSEMGARAELLDSLPRLRRHSASLTSAADALSTLRGASGEMRGRLEKVIDEESQSLGRDIEELASLVERMQHEGERLVPLWSNDLWDALNERLAEPAPKVVPVGMPAWFKGDATALLVLLGSLLEVLRPHLDGRELEGEVCLGNRRVYLDLVWRGQPLGERQLNEWQQQRLDDLPLSPRVSDVLRQHASDAWSLADADGEHADDEAVQSGIGLERPPDLAPQDRGDEPGDGQEHKHGKQEDLRGRQPVRIVASANGLVPIEASRHRHRPHPRQSLPAAILCAIAAELKARAAERPTGGPGGTKRLGDIPDPGYPPEHERRRS